MIDSMGLKLICGLGNPGREYEKSRHNIGFEFLELLAGRMNLDFSMQNKFQSLYARRDGLHFLMPQTFMNLSGRAVKLFADYFKISAQQILIVHDELDLANGRFQIKFAGGLAGHNGLKSVAHHLASNNFWRIRIGISRPQSKDKVVDYVLCRAAEHERKLQALAFETIMKNFDLILKGDPEELKKISHQRKIIQADER